jgi:putative ABC transport system permease protein
MTLVEPGVRLGIVLVLLVVLGVGASVAARLGVAAAVVRASARAVVQLAAVSLVIAAVLRSYAASMAFVALMLAVASATSGRRITRDRSAAWAGLAVAGGALPVVALVLGTGVVPREGIGLVPVAGIVIGGAMTATALAGRRALDELETRHGEYEAALAIGLDTREAGLEIARPAAAKALVPPLDQARTVGLVTLPGAYIGVLLGGGSAADAGAAQVLVLVGLLAAQAIAVAVTLQLVVRRRLTNSGTSHTVRSDPLSLGRSAPTRTLRHGRSARLDRARQRTGNHE